MWPRGAGGRPRLQTVGALFFSELDASGEARGGLPRLPRGQYDRRPGIEVRCNQGLVGVESIRHPHARHDGDGGKAAGNAEDVDGTDEGGLKRGAGRKPLQVLLMEGEHVGDPPQAEEA